MNLIRFLLISVLLGALVTPTTRALTSDATTTLDTSNIPPLVDNPFPVYPPIVLVPIAIPSFGFAYSYRVLAAINVGYAEAFRQLGFESVARYFDGRAVVFNLLADAVGEPLPSATTPFIIIGPGLPSHYREDAPDFMGPLAARPTP